MVQYSMNLKLIVMENNGEIKLYLKIFYLYKYCPITTEIW
jgi:hypothetical protein